VDTTTEFTTYGSVPGIGRDFAFSEYAAKGDLNKWSEPIKGKMNVYLIKVNYRTQYDPSLFEAQKAEIKKQLLFTKKSNFYGQWIQDLKKEADIVDIRYQFYR
ncbi:MAG: peptidylprolyl isomerase, partial [Melioribacteraceae bacterium]